MTALFIGSMFVDTHTRSSDQVAKLFLDIPRFTYLSEVFSFQNSSMGKLHNFLQNYSRSKYFWDFSVETGVGACGLSF